MTEVRKTETNMTGTEAKTGTMRAVVQEGDGSADVLHVRDIPLPVVADDRVLLRVRSSSVNAADYHSIRGGLLLTLIGKLMVRQKGPAVVVPGGDVSGEVVAVGKNVTELRPGDLVFGTGAGTWAEYATGSTRGLVAKPERLSFAQAGAVGVGGITALQGLRDHGGVGPGKRVLIYGAGGGVGTFAVQIAKALGAHVTAVTGTRNMDLVATLGADVLVDYNNEDVLKRADRYDAVIDIAATRSLGALRRVLAPAGTLVQIGAAKSGYLALFGRIIAGMFRRQVLKQRVVFFVAKIRRDDLLFLKQLIEEGKVTTVIDREYPLSEIREAVRYTLAGQGRAKVVVTVS